MILVVHTFIFILSYYLQTDHILINLDINELDDDLKVRKRSQQELDAPQEKHGLLSFRVVRYMASLYALLLL